MPEPVNVTRSQIIELFRGRESDLLAMRRRDPNDLGWTLEEWDLICMDYSKYSEYLTSLRYGIENGDRRADLIRQATALPFVPDEFWLYIDSPKPSGGESFFGLNCNKNML